MLTLQAVADQVHDAGLQRRGRKYRLQRLGNPLEAIGTAIRISATPRLRRSLKTFIQKRAPSVFSIQRPSASRLPSGRMPSARYTALLRTTPLSRILTRSASKNTTRVHGLQRPGLPGLDLLHDLIGHGTDELGADLGAVLLHQQALDLPYRHAPGVHGHDPLMARSTSAFLNAIETCWMASAVIGSCWLIWVQQLPGTGNAGQPGSVGPGGWGVFVLGIRHPPVRHHSMPSRTEFRIGLGEPRSRVR